MHGGLVDLESAGDITLPLHKHWALLTHDMATHTLSSLAGGSEASRQWRKEGKGR